MGVTAADDYIHFTMPQLLFAHVPQEGSGNKAEQSGKPSSEERALRCPTVLEFWASAVMRRSHVITEWHQAITRFSSWAIRGTDFPTKLSAFQPALPASLDRKV